MEKEGILIAFLVIFITASFYKGINYRFGSKQSSNEPPFIPQNLPFIGHILGIMRNGTNYYNKVSSKYPLPIYSLRMLGGRMYIVNSPDLVLAVQRNAKAFNSGPFTAKFAAQVFALSKETEAIWLRNVDGEEGDWGLHLDGMKGIHKALTLGKPDLENLNNAMLRNISGLLENLGNETQSEIPLLRWLRHEMMVAVTDAIYGLQNPFKTRKVEDGFWDFYNDFTMLLVNIMPRFTASKGFRGRERVFEALEEYIRTGGPQHGSGLLKARYNISLQYNVSAKDIAHFEIGNVLAALANITPTTFWMIWHVYSNPSVLENLRAELVQAVSTTVNSDGTKSWHIDPYKLANDCRLLNSVFQEVLRIRSTNASVRVVVKDTVLDDRYFLKKDSVIHMPSRVIHSDQSVWGPDATKFEANRFVQQKQKQHPGAFRGFGGGTTLCPGRHFATTTIISLVAMVILRYELLPAEGEWEEPTQNAVDHVAAVLGPDQDTLVKVSVRGMYEKGQWSFEPI